MESVVTPPPRPHHPVPVSLAKVLDLVGGSRVEGNDVTVTGVSISSSQTQPGDVFVGIPGATNHGAGFSAEAVAAGARAIITDVAGRKICPDLGVPVGVVENPRALLGAISGSVYSTPGPGQRVFAVTGTNGKTSVTFFLDEIFRRLGELTALSNSSERRVAGQVFRTKLTTPEANELHAMLALGAEQGVTVLCLEASAQAIERSRLSGLPINVAGFTNLSHDHFEDYGDMDRYLATKAKLFTPELSERAVVCVDTPWGERVVEQSTVPVATLGRETTSRADWTYRVTGRGRDTTDFVVTGPEGALTTKIHAVGDHMVQNAALALVMVLVGGVPLHRLREAVSPPLGELSVIIPGRGEKVSGDSPVAVYVDAGRSADAYEKTFGTLRSLTSGSLIAVCGTSGNRDPSKRSDMGRIAATLADRVIITDDDPRFEDPADIRRGLLDGARTVAGAEVVEVENPVEAIREAISLAQAGDIIVWCGPGSQLYREIRGERIPFSARDEVRRALHDAGLAMDGGVDVT